MNRTYTGLFSLALLVLLMAGCATPYCSGVRSKACSFDARTSFSFEGMAYRTWDQTVFVSLCKASFQCGLYKARLDTGQAVFQPIALDPAYTYEEISLSPDGRHLLALRMPYNMNPFYYDQVFYDIISLDLKSNKVTIVFHSRHYLTRPVYVGDRALVFFTLPDYPPNMKNIHKCPDCTESELSRAFLTTLNLKTGEHKISKLFLKELPVFPLAQNKKLFYAQKEKPKAVKIQRARFLYTKPSKGYTVVSYQNGKIEMKTYPRRSDAFRAEQGVGGFYPWSDFSALDANYKPLDYQPEELKRAPFRSIRKTSLAAASNTNFLPDGFSAIVYRANPKQPRTYTFNLFGPLPKPHHWGLSKSAIITLEEEKPSLSIPSIKESQPSSAKSNF